jgi:hypothetical protein
MVSHHPRYKTKQTKDLITQYIVRHQSQDESQRDEKEGFESIGNSGIIFHLYPSLSSSDGIFSVAGKVVVVTGATRGIGLMVFELRYDSGKTGQDKTRKNKAIKDKTIVFVFGPA